MAEEEGHQNLSFGENEEEKKNLRVTFVTESACEPSYSRGPRPTQAAPEPFVSSITKLVVRPWAPQTNPNDHVEGGEDIDEEQAICKLCSSLLIREENIAKIKCKCISDLALAHEACVGDSCNVCRLEIQKTRIRLDRVPVPARHEEENRRRSRRKSRSLCFKR